MKRIEEAVAACDSHPRINFSPLQCSSTSQMSLLEQIRGSVHYRFEAPLLGWSSAETFLSSTKFDPNKVGDLAHIHLPQGRPFSIELLGKLATLRPTVWTMHDTWGLTPAAASGVGPLGESLLRIRKERAFSRLKVVIVPGAWMQSRLQMDPIFANVPSTVIPHPLPMPLRNPVKPEFARRQLGLNPQVPVVAFVAWKAWKTGRDNKGYDLFQEALARVRQCHPVNGIVVGHATQTPVPNELLWVGPADSLSELGQKLAAADVVVVPSRMESFGLVSAEAQSFGKVVVVADGSGLVDTIAEGESGLSFRNGSAEDLSRKLLELLQRPELVKKMGIQAALRAATVWSPETIGESYWDVYNSITAP